LLKLSKFSGLENVFLVINHLHELFGLGSIANMNMLTVPCCKMQAFPNSWMGASRI